MDFFGFFICHFIDDGGGDDIEGGASTSDELVLQCFAIQKPFEVLMLNERFAEKYSLRDGHKVVNLGGHWIIFSNFYKFEEY